MKHIKPIQEFLSEAISMKMYKENLPKELWYDKSEGYKNWDKIFGKNINRISIPLKDGDVYLPFSTPLMEEINSIFVPLGYKINSFEDYVYNKAYKIGDTKNPLKIGKLLSKIDPTLFKKYDTSLERSDWKQKIENSNKELKIIISRHPYDLLGMSSGRDWRMSSCMRLGTSDDKIYNLLGFGENENDGGFKDSIKKDIEYGVLVAYVVKSDDNNINNPISRLLIKPYINQKDSKDILWVSSDKLYGKNVGGFKYSVNEWLSSWQGNNFNGLYCIKSRLYSDGKDKVNITPHSFGNNLGLFLNEVVRGTWVVNKTGEVDVKGDVWMTKRNLTKIPIKFGDVSGMFNCSNNQLTSLEGCPSKVGGNFYCSDNQLTSLEFCPSVVDGSFWCYNNQLTSLEFAPTIVGGNFYCSNNQLKTLKGCPKNIDGDFNCSYNNLTSLQFSPTHVSKFDCSNNQLTSLDFCVRVVEGGDFNCSNNQLTSLVGLPKKIQVLDCSNNQLTSLVGLPKKIQDLDCSNNQLTSLVGAPTNVKFKFNCKGQKNGHKFKEEDIRAVCKVGWLIVC